MTNLGRIQHNYVVRYNQVKDGVKPNFHRFILFISRPIHSLYTACNLYTFTVKHIKYIVL